MMRRLIHAAFATGLVLTPMATAAVSAVSVHAAHADDAYNCDAPGAYMPCDGSNLDYLGDGSPPIDSVYGEPLGDPGDPPWWNSGESLDG